MAPKRIPLIQRPTPLHRLDRASARLGIDLWIKRDDLTGFALGGNKGRKLEYLMAEAVEQGAEVVVTCGASQSNFIRQLGAACRCLGMQCVAAVMDLPFEPAYGKPAGAPLSDTGANLLLDGVLGVELRRFPDGSWEELFSRTEQILAELRGQGRRAYSVPIGGSTGLGAYGFFQGAGEVMQQAQPFETVVTASSSGSTQAGLAYGFHGTLTHVIGISCDPEPDLSETMVGLCSDLDRLTGQNQRLVARDFDLRFDWVGPGYGVPSEASISAIRFLAETEGIFLDPIYSGKSFAGLMELAKSGELPGRVLFWHTGGTPTVFAAPQFSEGLQS